MNTKIIFAVWVVGAGLVLSKSVRAESLPLPAEPSVHCGPAAFYNLTKQNRACSVQFYHRKDPSRECCEGLAQWYGPNSTLPSRNCFCNNTVWKEFQALTAETYYEWVVVFKMCSAMGLLVPYYQEDDNGTATGACTGAPLNMTELQAACHDDCPITPAASLQDWTARLHLDPLVFASVITGALSGVGILFLFLPLAMEVILGTAIKLAGSRNAPKQSA